MIDLTPAKNVVKALRRQAHWIILGSLLGSLAGVAALFMLPKLYRASTMIMVEPQKVPKEYVKTTVTGTIEERLRTLKQQITNRDTVLQVVLELDLYPELRNEPFEYILRRARRDMDLRVTGSAVFSIVYTYWDAQLAADAANRFAGLFISQNLQLRESQVENTSAFLESELRSTKNQLEAQEARVAQFRLEHEGELPSQREATLSMIGRLETQLRIVEDELAKGELKQMILSRSGQDRAPGKAPSKDAERLEEARSELLALQSRFTERHPDIIRLKLEIDFLEKTLVSAGSRETVSGEPRDSPDLLAVNAELDELKAERGRLLNELAYRQARLERIPRVEQELLKLTRDYDNLRLSYESLLDKRLDARLAENLEKRQQSEQFTVLEEALAPEEPYFPKQGLVLAVATLLGMLLGGGLALLLEELLQTLDDSEALLKAFPAVSLLASIPQFEASKEPRSFWKKVEKRASA